MQTVALTPALLAAALLATALLAACVTTEPEPQITGKALFEDNCASCHGVSGIGDGPAASGLSKPPADLTHISARNGGEFPMARVMSTINGYFRTDDTATIMPHFGDLLEGDTVLVDTGDGILTPTPERLVLLGEYLRSIQK